MGPLHPSRLREKLYLLKMTGRSSHRKPTEQYGESNGFTIVRADYKTVGTNDVNIWTLVSLQVDCRGKSPTISSLDQSHLPVLLHICFRTPISQCGDLFIFILGSLKLSSIWRMGSPPNLPVPANVLTPNRSLDASKRASFPHVSSKTIAEDEPLIWLVVWTPLKNISQLGWLFPIYGKIKNGNQTTNQ